MKKNQTNAYPRLWEVSDLAASRGGYGGKGLSLPLLQHPGSPWVSRASWGCDTGWDVQIFKSFSHFPPPSTAFPLVETSMGLCWHKTALRGSEIGWDLVLTPPVLPLPSSSWLWEQLWHGPWDQPGWLLLLWRALPSPHCPASHGCVVPSLFNLGCLDVRSFWFNFHANQALAPEVLVCRK